jgi:F-type H+-transporting ATPase subunit a
MAVPVAAETIFHLGPLPVTNSLVMGWVAVFLTIVLAFAINRRLAAVPRGVQNWFEWLVEQMMNYMDQVTNDRALTRKFLPVIGTLFPLILASNWLGLFILAVPVHLAEGGHELPLLRAFTADLNATVAMAIFSVVISHVLGFVALGFWKYGNKFVKLGDLWRALLGFGRKPLAEASVGLLVAVVELGVGLIEIVSEVAKVISLSLRLFGNIYAGEVLLHVIASLTGKLPPFLLPLPFMAMELLVGIVQAAVFSMLSLVYLTLAVEKPHGEHEGGEHHGPAAEAIVQADAPAR